MKISAFEIVYLLIALALIAYGYWGLMTESGSRHYDEMDGMIPFLFGFVPGGVIILIWLGFRIYNYFFLKV